MFSSPPINETKTSEVLKQDQNYFFSLFKLEFSFAAEVLKQDRNYFFLSPQVRIQFRLRTSAGQRDNQINPFAPGCVP
jgi:hypothetical protein